MVPWGSMFIKSTLELVEMDSSYLEWHRCFCLLSYLPVQAIILLHNGKYIINTSTIFALKVFLSYISIKENYIIEFQLHIILTRHIVSAADTTNVFTWKNVA